jgi:hypothetical protein
VVGSLTGVPMSEETFDLSVDQSGAGLDVAHSITLKDIPSVLVLLLHLDAEEVVKGVEVLHGELLLESCSGMLEKLWAQGYEDDVVDVE